MSKVPRRLLTLGGDAPEDILAYRESLLSTDEELFELAAKEGMEIPQINRDDRPFLVRT